MPQALTGMTAELGFKRRDNLAAYARAYRAKNRDKTNDYMRRRYHEKVKTDPVQMRKRCEASVWTRRKRKYGITRSLYIVRVKEQQGACSICNKFAGMDLRVDHCHATGKIRGLLCATCNTGLGQFKDDQTVLRRAAEYLEKEGHTICRGPSTVQLGPTEIMH